MSKQVPVDDSAVVEGVDDDGVHQITPDVAYKRLAMVNIAFYGTPASSARSTAKWVLIDAGLPGMTGMITRSAA